MVRPAATQRKAHARTQLLMCAHTCICTSGPHGGCCLRSCVCGWRAQGAASLVRSREASCSCTPARIARAEHGGCCLTWRLCVGVGVLLVWLCEGSALLQVWACYWCGCVRDRHFFKTDLAQRSLHDRRPRGRPISPSALYMIDVPEDAFFFVMWTATSTPTMPTTPTTISEATIGWLSVFSRPAGGATTE